MAVKRYIEASQHGSQTSVGFRNIMTFWRTPRQGPCTHVVPLNIAVPIGKHDGSKEVRKLTAVQVVGGVV